MSASRPFIEVLAGKLTAYDGASSRPTAERAGAILAPVWLASLPALPVAAAAAARAYVSLAGVRPTAPTAPASSGAAHAGAPATTRRRVVPGTTAHARPPRRTAAQLAAIQLLRRLGADDVDATSSDAQLRSACRRLLRQCHPDAHPHLDSAGVAALNVRLRAVLHARAALALPASPRAVMPPGAYPDCPAAHDAAA